jgi:hypothetical protein
MPRNLKWSLLFPLWTLERLLMVENSAVHAIGTKAVQRSLV